jgi:hypothetical protein
MTTTDFYPNESFASGAGNEELQVQQRQPLPQSGSQTKTLTYLVPDDTWSPARKTELVLFILFLALLIAILVICIVFLAPQTPYNLGSTLCCSPQNMFLGQRLQNGIWYLKLDQSGDLSLYKDDPNASPAVTIIWSTNTSGRNVSFAYLSSAGTLSLINNQGIEVWSTPPPETGTDFVVPVAPYRLVLEQDGTTRIVSSNGIDVWIQPSTTTPFVQSSKHHNPSKV